MGDSLPTGPDLPHSRARTPRTPCESRALEDAVISRFTIEASAWECNTRWKGEGKGELGDAPDISVRGLHPVHNPAVPVVRWGRKSSGGDTSKHCSRQHGGNCSGGWTGAAVG